LHRMPRGEQGRKVLEYGNARAFVALPVLVNDLLENDNTAIPRVAALFATPAVVPFAEPQHVHICKVTKP
jgi:hypothetical protein